MTRAIAVANLLLMLVMKPALASSDCPRVNVDRKAWRVRMKKVRNVAEVKTLLKELGLGGAVLDPECTTLERPLAVDLFSAALVDPNVQDTVIQVRGRLCRLEFRAGVVLHPLNLAKPQQFCATPLPFVRGDAISADANPYPRSCSKLTFKFIRAMSHVGQAFQVDSECSDSHESFSDVELWEFQKGALRQIWFHSTADQEVGGHTNTKYNWRFEDPSRRTISDSSAVDSVSAFGTDRSHREESNRYCYVEADAGIGEYKKCR